MKESELRKEKLAFIHILLSDNDGYIEVNNDKVKSVFYDIDDKIKIEYTDGAIGLIDDIDDDMIHGIGKKWAEGHPRSMKRIYIEVLLGKPFMEIKHHPIKSK